MYKMIIDVQKKIFDGFIQDDASLDRPLPAFLSVTEHCFVDVSQYSCAKLTSHDKHPFILQCYVGRKFSKVVSVRHLRVMPKGLGIAWEWNWIDHELDSRCADEEEEKSSDDDKAGESMETESEFSEESDDAESVDTVTFKCIGASREVYSQEALAAAAKMEKGEAVTVRILPEPTNPYDSNAIAFQCKVDDSWVTNGYIVKEVLQHVHTAIQSNVLATRSPAFF